MPKEQKKTVIKVIGKMSKMTFDTFESKAVFIRDRLRGSHPKDHFWVGICKVDSFFRVCSIEINDYLFSWVWRLWVSHLFSYSPGWVKKSGKQQ